MFYSRWSTDGWVHVDSLTLHRFSTWCIVKTNYFYQENELKESYQMKKKDVYIIHQMKVDDQGDGVGKCTKWSSLQFWFVQFEYPKMCGIYTHKMCKYNATSIYIDKTVSAYTTVARFFVHFCLSTISCMPIQWRFR